MSELRTVGIKTPQLRALAPLRVQTIFYYCEGDILLVLEGDSNLCQCVAFYNFPDAVQSALELGLIPQSNVEHVRSFPLGPESPVVVGGWVACNKNTLAHFQTCDPTFKQ